MNKFLRTLVYRLIYYLQLHRLIRLALRDKGIILTYHGFTDKKHQQGIENYQGKHIYIEKFEEQMRYLKRNYRVISLGQLVDGCIKGEKMSPGAVVITMDDGYQSNHRLAFPVLKKYGLPATIFLTTDFVEHEKSLWPDRLEYAINKARSGRYALSVDGDFPTFHLEFQDEESKREVEGKLRKELKSLPQELRPEIMERLESKLGKKLRLADNAPDIYRPLTWSEISEMIQSGLVAIGSHTHTHIILARAAEKNTREELRLSKEIIEARAETHCDLFAYPNGQMGDFDEATKTFLKESGYACGLTAVEGFNDRDSDPFELKRLGVGNQVDFIEFVMTLCGVKIALTELKKTFREKARNFSKRVSGLATKISKAMSLFGHNPLLLGEIVYANTLNRLAGVPKSPVLKEVRGVKFEFDFDYGPQVKKMYFNAYEPLTIRAMKRWLKSGDVFFDVGASIGFLSWIAAGLVGQEGQIHCFEPSPRDFNQLEKLRFLNPSHKIFCHPSAAGEKNEMMNMDISRLPWVGWNTLVPTFMRKNDHKETIQVEVTALEDYIEKHRSALGRITMIKIDVEGFEYFVLKGLQRFFSESQNRPAILCEVTPRANGLMGISMQDLSSLMARYGYQAYSLLDGKTKVELTDLKVQTDVIFLCQR